jgi:hypothetical protein
MIFRVKDSYDYNNYLDEYFVRYGESEIPSPTEESVYTAKFYCKGELYSTVHDKPRCDVFKLPEFDFRYHDYFSKVTGKLTPSRPIPDVATGGHFLTVSERFWKLICDSDAADWYQVHPTEYRDVSGRVLNKEPVYFLHVRRSLVFSDEKFDPIEMPKYPNRVRYNMKDRTMKIVGGNGEKLPITNDDFFIGDDDLHVVSAIQNSRLLREAVEEFPIWRETSTWGSRRIYYMNQRFFDAVQREKISGLNEFSAPGGKKWENVSHV